MTTKTDRAKTPEPESTADEFLTVPEAAAALRIGVSTLRTWIAQGVVEAAQPRRAYLIPRREVARLLAPRRAVRA